MAITILENCSGCGSCLPACPQRALTLTTAKPNGFGKKSVVVTGAACLDCRGCIPACPLQALIE